MKEFTISSILRESWSVIKRSPWPLIRLAIGHALLLFSAIFAITLLVLTMAMVLSIKTTCLAIILGLLYVIPVSVLRANYIRGLFSVIDEGDVGVVERMAAVNIREGFRLFVADLLYAIVGLLGSLALIIPGLWWFLNRGLHSFYLIDHSTDAFGALAGSRTLTKGNLMVFFGLLLVMALVYVGPHAIALLVTGEHVRNPIASIVSLFFSPFTMVPWAVAYRMLQSRTKDSVNCDV